MSGPSPAVRCAIALLAALALPAEDAPGAPPAPTGATCLAVPATATCESGRGWPTRLRGGRESFHFDGAAVLAIDLSGLALTPGWYRIGLLARTGTRWNTPADQVPAYRLGLRDADGERDLGTVERLPAAPFEPRLDASEVGTWGNWYGAVQCAAPVQLKPGARLVVANRSGHGGVLAVWALPVAGLAAASLRLDTGMELSASIADQIPTLTVHARLPGDHEAVEGFLRLIRSDLRTGVADRRHLPMRLEPGRDVSIAQPYPAEPGVFRVSAALVRGVDDPEPETGSASRLYACAQARQARDLPDDWPLGTHVSTEIPPLPGFRWFRYFAGWHRINPARGVYHWEEYDRVLAAVRSAGGKLFIADDGSPLWTSRRGKAGMPWAATATAHPPDDWQDLEAYLRALIARSDDAAGTLGALELCNEANTPERWLGGADGLVQMARTFRAAAATARHPVTVVGVAVSAGDQRDYVAELAAAGLLREVDAVSGHWYEEMMSFERATPINNLPLHVELLAGPVRAAGLKLPLINSECGVEFAPREHGRMVAQEELSRRAEADPAWKRSQPWLVGDYWRPVSERRAAATYVAATVMLMASGVERSFSFSHLDFLVEGVPSLPWVALGQLGHHLDGVDYHQIRQLPAQVVGSDGKDGSPLALAYQLGRPGARQVIVAWSFLSDTSVGRSRHWQRWLDPIDIKITCDLPAAECIGLYGIEAAPLTPEAGTLLVTCGEEPVFIRAPAR